MPDRFQHFLYNIKLNVLWWQLILLAIIIVHLLLFEETVEKVCWMHYSALAFSVTLLVTCAFVAKLFHTSILLHFSESHLQPEKYKIHQKFTITPTNIREVRKGKVTFFNMDGKWKADCFLPLHLFWFHLT